MVKTRLTPETLMVYEIDTEKISRECNEAIHKKSPDEKYTFSILKGLAITLDPPAIFSSECAGRASEKYELDIYGEVYNAEGKLVAGECFPRFSRPVNVKDLVENYSLGQMSLKDFMTKHNNWRPEHHRVGANIREWMRYFNKED